MASFARGFDWGTSQAGAEPRLNQPLRKSDPENHQFTGSFRDGNLAAMAIGRQAQRIWRPSGHAPFARLWSFADPIQPQASPQC